MTGNHVDFPHFSAIKAKGPERNYGDECTRKKLSEVETMQINGKILIDKNECFVKKWKMEYFFMRIVDTISDAAHFYERLFPGLFLWLLGYQQTL